jgi:hypothetical protein
MGTATERQVSFLTDLLAKREVDHLRRVTIQAALDSGKLDSKGASEYIDRLLRLPKKVQPNAWDAANAATADLEVSFYAVPAGLVSAQKVDLYGNDFLFLRVRNMGGGRGKRLSRVSGAPGSPRYTGFSPDVIVSLAAVMRGRHVEFAQNWHKHSGRCGKCNAVLTDIESREAGFGPDCRKMYGL